MTNLEMVQIVWAEQPEATASELVASVERRFGLKIEARFLPLFLATIRDKKLQASAREKRRDETGASSEGCNTITTPAA